MRFKAEIIRNIIEKLPKKDKIIGTYIPTKKNPPVKEFFDKVNFAKESEDKKGRKVYKFDYKKKILPTKWIKLK